MTTYAGDDLPIQFHNLIPELIGPRNEEGNRAELGEFEPCNLF